MARPKPEIPAAKMTLRLPPDLEARVKAYAAGRKLNPTILHLLDHALVRLNH